MENLRDLLAHVSIKAVLCDHPPTVCPSVNSSYLNLSFKPFASQLLYRKISNVD